MMWTCEHRCEQAGTRCVHRYADRALCPSVDMTSPGDLSPRVLEQLARAGCPGRPGQLPTGTGRGAAVLAAGLVGRPAGGPSRDLSILAGGDEPSTRTSTYGCACVARDGASQADCPVHTRRPPLAVPSDPPIPVVPS